MVVHPTEIGEAILKLLGIDGKRQAITEFTLTCRFDGTVPTVKITEIASLETREEVTHEFDVVPKKSGLSNRIATIKNVTELRQWREESQVIDAADRDDRLLIPKARFFDVNSISVPCFHKDDPRHALLSSEVGCDVPPAVTHDNPADPNCEACHGTGEIKLFTSVSICACCRKAP